MSSESQAQGSTRFTSHALLRESLAAAQLRIMRHDACNSTDVTASGSISRWDVGVPKTRPDQLTCSSDRLDILSIFTPLSSTSKLEDSGAISEQL